VLNESADASSAWLVACLCAAWCRTCDDYRQTFDSLSNEFSRAARFVWVDIEDDEAALAGVDVVDFPTLLLANGETIHFYGPVLPHAQIAHQLVQRALQGALTAAPDAALVGQPGRVRALR